MIEKIYPYNDCVFKLRILKPDQSGRVWGILDIATLQGEGHLITPQKIEVFTEKHWLDVARLATSRNSGNAALWTQRTEQVRVALYEDADITALYSEPGLGDLVGNPIPAMDMGLLQAQARSGQSDAIESLPFLGLNIPIFLRYYTQILATDPKGGKTELLYSLIRDWAAQGYSIGYYTEEPETVWRARLQASPDFASANRPALIFCLGRPYSDIIRTIQVRRDNVTVIDTTKLLNVENENDVGYVSRAVTPVIAAARDCMGTLILVHHHNKTGGQRGKALAGSHAWLALADSALEIEFDPNHPKRRKISGLGRVVSIPEVVYEMGDDRLMHFVGNIEDMEWQAILNKVWEASTDTWLKTDEIRDRMDKPATSRPTLIKALTYWTNKGDMERDPPLSLGQQAGTTYRWRIAQT